MELASRWKAFAAAGGATLALAGAGVLAPAAPASRAVAASTRSCGNHAVTFEFEEAGQPVRKLKALTKNVKATGLTCPAAFKFLSALYKDHTTTPPEHFKCKTGKFKEPAGYVPQVCTHASKKIEYGAQGG